MSSLQEAYNESQRILATKDQEIEQLRTQLQNSQPQQTAGEQQEWQQQLPAVDDVIQPTQASALAAVVASADDTVDSSNTDQTASSPEQTNGNAPHIVSEPITTSQASNIQSNHEPTSLEVEVEEKATKSDNNNSQAEQPSSKFHQSIPKFVPYNFGVLTLAFLSTNLGVFAGNENSALDEANRKFARLKAEAKSRIKTLNEQNEKLQQQIKDLEKGGNIVETVL